MKKFIIVLLCFICSFMFIGCGNDELSKVKFNDAEFTYDGNEHSIFISNLPTGYTVIYSNNKQTEVGDYEVTANLYLNNELKLSLKANLKIKGFEIPFDVSKIHFDDVDIEYDGNIHSILLGGELPNGYNITYLNNDHSEIGTHLITAIISANGVDYYELTAVLTIRDVGYSHTVGPAY